MTCVKNTNHVRRKRRKKKKVLLLNKRGALATSKEGAPAGQALYDAQEHGYHTITAK